MRLGWKVLLIVAFSALGVSAVAVGFRRSGGDGPRATVRAYAQAVFAYGGKPVTADGDRICRFFTPHLRQVYDEEAAQRGAKGGCGSLLHVAIGYPHENAESDFVGGRLLRVGGERHVTRHGVRYIGVSLQARIDSAWTGYAVGRRAGARFSRIVKDIVWLQQVRSGTWRLAKPSLILDVALAPDFLIEPRARAASTPPLAPPPDPKLLTHAERLASDERAYRASLRTPRRNALECAGRTTVYRDATGDVYRYGTDASGHYGPTLSVGAKNGDIERVGVTYNGLGRGACVSITFTAPPRGPLAIAFDPTGADLFDSQVFLIAGGKVRAGTMSSDSYELAAPRPGDPFSAEVLHPQSVTAVAVSGRSVSFLVAPESVLGIHPSASVTAQPLRWSVRASIPRQVASDVVPGRNPEHVVDLGVDQATGRVVRRY
jgi:hypothetical protein